MARPRRPATAAAPGGFTLVELVLVAAIVAAGAAVAVPRYGRSLAHARLDAAAGQVAARLNFAREAAAAASTPVAVGFEPATGRVTLSGLPASFGTGPDAAAGVGPLLLGEEPFGVRLVSASFAGPEGPAFDASGRPDAGGAVTLGLGGLRREVTLEAATGRVRWSR